MGVHSKGRQYHIERARIIHNDKYYYDLVPENVTHDTYVTIMCPKHGLFDMRWRNHIQGQNCPRCANESRSRKRREYMLNIEKRR